MKKKLFLVLLGTFTVSSYAFDLNITSKGLSGEDKISIVISSQKGNCQPHDSHYNCEKVTYKPEGLPIKYLQDYFDIYKSGYENYRLTELGFKINGQSFPSCEHLEARGQHLSVILTPSGCL
jgi:hypothetical protein